eukprot:scaffold51128_cov78-Cyclotella_meneghiniana.AAC.10
MAHRHPYIYSGSSSDEAWARNTTSNTRPSRRIIPSSSEGESDDHIPRRNYYFLNNNNRTIDTSSDSDHRYNNSSSEYESSDSDRRRPLQYYPPQTKKKAYVSSDSEDYFTEDEEVNASSPELFTSLLFKLLRPRSIIGALVALALALCLPLFADRSFTYSALSIRKVSRLPKYMLDSLYDTAKSFIYPGAASLRSMRGIQRPDFVYEHPYVSSSYYTSTNNTKVLIA